MHVAIVIPCFNEEGILASTCASLGFGVNADITSDTTLLLVDNGSTDNTIAVAAAIRERSPEGTVVLVNEPNRGYVSARHRGILATSSLAASRGIAADEILVLQGDADTTYGEGYVAAMRAAAEDSGRSVMLKARTLLAQEFAHQHAEYLRLCDSVDSNFESLLSDHPDDVIIDDKACGYWLTDYFGWGGHQREFAPNGDEIFAETTRLYLRAKSLGTTAILVDNAEATHSTRRILEHAGLDLATSGFPRERSWRDHWKRRLAPIASIDHLGDAANHCFVEIALQWRRRHVLALFGILPLHVARTLGVRSSLESPGWAGRLSLPARPLTVLQAAPAVFVGDALEQAERLQ